MRMLSAVQRFVVVLPLVLCLGCMENSQPAKGPVKETPKAVTSTEKKESPYAVPDFPETSKTDAPVTTPTERPAIEPPASEKPSATSSTANTPDKSASDKPADEKPAAKPEESKPEDSKPEDSKPPESTPQASAPSSTASETAPKGPFKDDPFPYGEPVLNEAPKKDATP